MFILTKTGSKQIAESVLAFLQRKYLRHASEMSIMQEGKLCHCVIYHGYAQEEILETVGAFADGARETLEFIEATESPSEKTSW